MSDPRHNHELERDDDSRASSPFADDLNDIGGPDVYDDHAHVSAASDPWAHRRAEPRLFAFLWTLYLFVTVLGSLLWLTSSGVLAASAYGPAARIMLIVIACGATILWPMVRLSQLAPGPRPLASAFGDFVVIVMPVQVVVWPLAFLANWPLKVVAVLSAMLFVWPLLISGLLAIAFAWCHRCSRLALGAFGRVAWMILCIAVVCAGPLVVVITEVGEHIDLSNWAWKLSPFTFVFLITGTGLRGPHAPIGLQDWFSLAPVAAAGMLSWLIAWVVASRQQGRRQDIPTVSGMEDAGELLGGAESSGRDAATRLDSQTNN